MRGSPNVVFTLVSYSKVPLHTTIHGPQIRLMPLIYTDFFLEKRKKNQCKSAKSVQSVVHVQ
jgi:hypothetical protein